MEQGRGPGEGDNMNHQRDHRSFPPPHQVNQNLHPAPAPPPQKCPRCDSMNTKFCYYNNYSLSQPRYFCKSCRRYWTQGGTLRNVPIGGGCRRKGKRPKISAPSNDGEDSRTQSLTPPLPSQLHVSHNLTSMASLISGSSSGLLPASQSLLPLISPMGSLYSGGPFLSMQPGINMGGPQLGGGGNDKMIEFEGFNFPALGSQSLELQLQNESVPIRPLEPWTQIFMNNSAKSSAPRPDNFWNSNSGKDSGGAGSSINPNHWPDDNL